MYTIICLGSKACDIGELFEEKKIYNVKLFDVDIEGENCYSIKHQDSPENYEKCFPDVSEFLKDTRQEVIFITSGDSQVASCSLRILQHVKNKNISVMYLKPDLDFFSKEAILLDKVYFNVLQEYARSGLFKSVFLLDSKKIDNLIGDVSVVNYQNEFNKLVFNTIHGILHLKNVEPVISNSSEQNEINRIYTLGYYYIDNNMENMFFDLKNIQEKCYNFVINNDELKKNNKLFKTIKENIKNKSVDNEKISYMIYPTDNEANYCLVIANTKFIQ